MLERVRAWMCVWCGRERGSCVKVRGHSVDTLLPLLSGFQKSSSGYQACITGQQASLCTEPFHQLHLFKSTFYWFFISSDGKTNRKEGTSNSEVPLQNDSERPGAHPFPMILSASLVALSISSLQWIQNSRVKNDPNKAFLWVSLHWVRSNQCERWGPYK